jgi:hypothetical protein
MELLERYLQAVRFWLPKEQKQDIIAELSEDIRSQVEERETELGRKLNEAEIEAILKERGRPVLVANRYQPQQYLIGPVLFPIYRFVLKIVALCYLLPSVLVWICLMSFSSPYRAEHGSWIASLGSAWGSLWTIAFITIGTVTLVFAILERAQTKSRFLEDWNPRKLPPLRNPNLIPRSASVIELVANFGFLIWWGLHMSSRTFLDRPEIRISLTPAWTYFFWGFSLLAVLNLAVSGVNLMRPYWTGLRATFRLVTNGIASALFCWLVKANVLEGIVVPNVSPARLLEITHAINLWMARSFPFVVVLGVVIAATDVYRIVRVRSKPSPFAPAVPAAVV